MLHGHIFSLDVGGGGKYDFRKNFTIKNFFWQKTLFTSEWKYGQPLREGIDYEYIKNASERDFEHAIGYIPTYR